MHPNRPQDRICMHPTNCNRRPIRLRLYLSLDKMYYNMIVLEKNLQFDEGE